ncbi:hypothetical protein [Candidatus Regiella insecticola]|uniref:hypothetical protein n=1 Tax=Candidatus Regiella insecticola TaxID=138073 RepID=UPI001596DDDE|nr:hypothetical protein [Candidatus Regiella insecticola]
MAVSSPWLDISVKIDAENINWVNNVITEHSIGRRAEHANQLFSFFSKLPFLYIMPRNVNPVPGYITANKNNKILSSTKPLDFFYFISDRLNLSQEKIDARIPDNFEWSENDVLEFSKIPNSDNLYGPYAAYTHIRESRLLHQASKSQESQQFLYFLEGLRSWNESRFFEIMAQVMSQQFYKRVA